jgi:hypothetical protein
MGEVTSEQLRDSEAIMNNKSAALDLVVQAALKLGPRTPEWMNVVSFIQSCYACRVRSYDFHAALNSLCRLTDEEQSALIAWVMLAEDARERSRARE